MSSKPPETVDAPRSPREVKVDVNLKGTLQKLGGSRCDDWNNLVATQAIDTLSLRGGSDYADQHIDGALTALMCLKPKDELEGMLLVQMFGAHHAAMECYRRAMIPTQGIPAYAESLNQANKLSRTFAALLEALNRHRGKGSNQKVEVKHVHVHRGGQAVVGVVESTPGGGRAISEEQPYGLGHTSQREVWSEDAAGDGMPMPGDAERPLSDTRRPVPRGAKGQPKCPEARTLLSGSRRAPKGDIRATSGGPRGPGRGRKLNGQG